MVRALAQQWDCVLARAYRPPKAGVLGTSLVWRASPCEGAGPPDQLRTWYTIVVSINTPAIHFCYHLANSL